MRGSAIGHGALFAVFLAALLWACAICSCGLAAGPAGAIFSSTTPLIELNGFLSPYHPASNLGSDGSEWEILSATNRSVRPVSRILVAEDRSDFGLWLRPPAAMAAIRQVAVSDPDASVESASAYGRHAWRVTVPAERTVSVAIRLSDASRSPSVAAWDESALVLHIKQLAIFRGAVAGLLLSVLAIVSGLAVMTARAKARWAAFTLLGLFLSRLAASGVFDAMGPTNLGGPYGASAALTGLTFTAGLQLANAIAPFGAQSWLRVTVATLLGVCVAAYVGLPGAALIAWCVVVVGTAVIPVHLVRAASKGSESARTATPAALLFATAAMAGTLAAMSASGNVALASNLVSGFSSAGAILLTLAIAAGCEFTRGSGDRQLAGRQSATTHEKSTQQLHPSDALAAIAASHQGIFELHILDRSVLLSREAAILIGRDADPASFPLEEWIARIHPDDRNVFRTALEDFGTQTGLPFRIEFRVAREDGRHAWLELRATTNGNKNASTCLGLLADITMRKEPAPSSKVDVLTELPTRIALTDSLESLGSGIATAVLALLDIDRFKSVHASLGDAGADAVLITCARRLKEALSPFGEVYRVGGDGFAILFEELAGNSESIGQQIVQVVSEPVDVHSRSIYLSVSVGLARGREAEDGPSLYRNAERALFQAKRSGGGCARCYVPETDATDTTDAVALETDLRRALVNNELEVVYQPIMRLSDGSVSGFEALLRWTHPVRGPVDTQHFIAHSEESGSILELGKLVLTQAAAELARWQKFFPLEPPLTVSVNLSRRQLQDAEFGTLLSEVLTNGNVRQGTLMLELTETALGAVDDAREHLMRLKSAGVGLSLDDFGTGLSTLSQLKDLPFDTIKIDKSFLEQGDVQANTAILRSIMQLACDLNLIVVAEGVETARDARRLKEIGCEFVQGYFFSPPLPRGDVLAFVARHHMGADGTEAIRSGVAGMGGKSGDVDPELS